METYIVTVRRSTFYRGVTARFGRAAPPHTGRHNLVTPRPVVGRGTGWLRRNGTTTSDAES